MPGPDLDRRHMSRALELAVQGEGHVEPNPLVGCVVAHADEVVGEGWHQSFGGAHAEVEALRAAGDRARGATLYVTLEPCCHHGKTPPCTDAIIQAGVGRVVVAQEDPFPAVSGGGIKQLSAAGIPVETGQLAQQAADLNAPYRKLLRTGQPWVIAKWAMSLDGKLATREGDSVWISNAESRRIVHQLRGRVDAVMIGRGTAQRDNPLLTARPAGPRTAARVVLDSRGQLSSDSQLVQTLDQAPLIVAVGPHADAENCRKLRDAGCQIVSCSADRQDDRFAQLLDHLGQQRMTNVLVEGGGQLLGTLLDQRQIDEVHVFIAPKLIGGSAATSVAGHGIAEIQAALRLEAPTIQQLSGDVYIHGRIQAAQQAKGTASKR